MGSSPPPLRSHLASVRSPSVVFVHIENITRFLLPLFPCLQRRWHPVSRRLFWRYCFKAEICPPRTVNWDPTPHKMTSFPGCSLSQRVREKWNETRVYGKYPSDFYPSSIENLFIGPCCPFPGRVSKNGKLPDALKKDYGHNAILATRTN